MSNNWNGIGIPPIGTTGTADFHESIWPKSDLDRFIGETVTVVGHFEIKDGKKGIVIEHKTKGVGAVMNYQEGIIKPIKSDRDKAIDAMEAAWNEWSGTNTRASLGRLYDAGYRKQSGE